MKKLLVLLPVLLACMNFLCMPATNTQQDTSTPGGTDTANSYDIQPSAKLIELLGNEFVDKNGKKYDSRILGVGIIGLYFSASWCGPCTAFTPQLVNMYKQVKNEGKTFEVILVPSDRSDDEMYAYMSGHNMPWYAISRNSPTVDKLMQNYTVRGIPTLVIIDVDANTISTGGRSDVASNGAAAYDMWLEKAGF